MEDVLSKVRFFPQFVACFARQRRFEDVTWNGIGASFPCLTVDPNDFDAARELVQQFTRLLYQTVLMGTKKNNDSRIFLQNVDVNVHVFL